MVYIERIVYKTHSGGIRISMVWRLLGGETSLPLFLLVFVLFFLQAPPGHFAFCTKLGWDVLHKVSFEVCAHIYISSYTCSPPGPEWVNHCSLCSILTSIIKHAILLNLAFPGNWIKWTRIMKWLKLDNCFPPHFITVKVDDQGHRR